MSIKTKLLLIGILSTVFVLSIAVIKVYEDQQVGSAQERLSIVNDLVFAVFERNVFLNDFNLNQTERSKIQLIARNDDIGELLLLALSKAKIEENKKKLMEIEDNHSKVTLGLERVFEAITEEEGSSGEITLDTRQTISNIIIKSQSTVELSRAILSNLRDEADRIQKFSNTLLFVVIGASFLLSFFSVIINFDLIKSIRKFQYKAEKISGGDLSTRLEIKRKDEIGQLANSFDIMTEKLHASYRGLEQKVAERTKDLAKFKLAIESTTEQVIITDKNGIVVYGNPATERFTGYTVKEAVGMKAGKLWGGHMDKTFYEKMWETILIDKKVFSGELTNKRKNGEEYVVSLIISPVITELGEVEFFAAVERDITKEKQIDKAKTEFVSLASHQLRTPLSAIGWYTEMLLAGDAGKINKGQKKYLQEIYHGNERMVELVSALLNVSRLELGTFVVDIEPVNVVKLARSAIDEQKPQIDSKKIKFLPKFEEKLPVIPADPNLLRSLPTRRASPYALF